MSDIPMNDSIMVQLRSAEGAYGPEWGATATYSGHAQRASNRVMTTTGEEVSADLFVVLPGDAVIGVGDALEVDSARYHALTVEKFVVPGVVSNVQVAAKSVAEDLAG